ncbi:MAG: aspartate--tRNA ligase [Bacteroidia bacterium]|nr:aspartate--tRNA ligase [Bacteroidia bacterium]MCC6768787.1 aspartate--tRNA ligase [Bacteroidia bacterium]
MLRTHTCGELRLKDVGQTIQLAGWLARSRDLGGMTFIDLRDRFGITQLVFNMDDEAELCEKARRLGREFVIQVSGQVRERSNKNTHIATGDIEIRVSALEVLNPSITPPFTIEDDTDGGDDLRMRYRYLDLRRSVVRENLLLRHKLSGLIRAYLDKQQFIEVETPVLIKSTPEGARDFIVPSRMNQGEFYALPQSPQTFKQILMVAGFDRYYQIVKCFRDEDLRADRQPEFTQVDCELSFVQQADILALFEGLVRSLFIDVKGFDPGEFPKMTYDEAMRRFGNDKPDMRFGMEFCDLTPLTRSSGFAVFDAAELVLAITVPGAANYTRKQIDELTDWVKRPQIGAGGLIYMRYQEDGALKSSVDKFFNPDQLASFAKQAAANAGDLILILAGKEAQTRKAMSELRLEMGNRLGLRKKDHFVPLWVVDFPLLEMDEENGRWHAMHHPFTSPKPEHIALLSQNPGQVKANAYDLVINGTEIGGGSIRIHDKQLQQRMFSLLGFSDEEARNQFGFLMNAFEYGAPPHGGIALGFDRLCSTFGGADSIRDFIAFPKNNAGRDMMIDAPSTVHNDQLKELGINVVQK